MITHERLKEVVHYDKKTGIFTSNVSSRGRKIGKVLGTKDKSYLRIKIDGVLYRAHRLAWFYVTGKWPVFTIDHKNTIGIDNRWSNLRDVPFSINRENQILPTRLNKCGYLGVHKTWKGNSFIAEIGFSGKRKRIGYFSSAIDAHKAYISEKRKHHKGCTL